MLGHAEHPVLPQERAVVGLMQAGEPHLLPLAVGLHGPGDVVLIPQHGPAGRLLVQQDVPLGVDVLLHILVVVQVVGGHIGDHRHFGALAHTDQLEAGQLHHGHIFRGHLGQHGQQRRPDVAAQMHGAPGRLEKLADEGGGGGLAVRAGHRHDLAGAKIEKELHLTGHHGAGGNGVLQGFLIELKAGGAQDDVLPLEPVHVVLPQAQPDAQAPDGIGIRAELLHRLFPVAEGHFCPQAHKLLDQGLMADPRADESHLFAAHQRSKLLLFLLHNKNLPRGVAPQTAG